jgi:hypothetical protein
LFTVLMGIRPPGDMYRFNALVHLKLPLRAHGVKTELVIVSLAVSVGSAAVAAPDLDGFKVIDRDS